MADVTLRDVKTLYIDFHHYCYFKGYYDGYFL